MKARVPGAKGGQNINQMMKQAQKMQEDMATLQTELEDREYTAVAGGMVEVTVDGKHTLKKISIKPEAVDPDDIEMLEDFITIAVNEAINKAIETQEQEMGAITGGLNIPGLF